MNNTSNPNPTQSPGEEHSQGAERPEASSRPGHRVLDPLCSAIHAGAQQAKAAAEKAVPKVKAAVSDATYWLGFGMAFASIFSYTMVKELAPEVLKAGWRDGAQAGRKTAEDLRAQSETQPDAPASTPSPGGDPSRPDAQPGLA